MGTSCSAFKSLGRGALRWLIQKFIGFQLFAEHQIEQRDTATVVKQPMSRNMDYKSHTFPNDLKCWISKFQLNLFLYNNPPPLKYTLWENLIITDNQSGAHCYSQIIWLPWVWMALLLVFAAISFSGLPSIGCLCSALLLIKVLPF